MMRTVLRGLVAMLVLSGAASAQQTMYGSTDDGLFGTVNPLTGEFTTLGNPAAGIGKETLSGITFDASGRVFGTVPVTGQSNDSTELIEINPSTGALVDDIGPVQREGGSNLRITDLATQPGTGVLFGVSSGQQLYTISKTTAVATLVGNLESADFDENARGGLAFAPDGRLFLATVSSRLGQIDPTDASTIGDVVNLASCIDGLGIRSDGVAFATECDGGDLFRMDLVTGDLDDLDDENEDTTDIAFALQSGATSAPALSPLALGVLAAAVVGLGIRRLR